MAYLAVGFVQQVKSLGTELGKSHDGTGQDHGGGIVVEELGQYLPTAVLPHRPAAGEQFGQGVGGALAHVGAGVGRAALDGHDLDLQDVADADGRHGPEGQGPDEGLAVGQAALEGVDGEEGQLAAGRVEVGVAAEVDVDHLADLEGAGADQLDDVGEEVRHVPALGHGGQQPLHPAEEGRGRRRVGRVGVGEAGADLTGTYRLLEVLRVAHRRQGRGQLGVQQGLRGRQGVSCRGGRGVRRRHASRTSAAAAAAGRKGRPNADGKGRSQRRHGKLRRVRHAAMPPISTNYW